MAQTAFAVRELTFGDAIKEAIAEEMRRDPSVVLMGEDVAEAGFTGLGVGAAMAGMRPIVDIMFGDFMTIIMDQVVNQAAKIHYMSGGHWKCPLVIRATMGATRRSAAQHSQSLHAWPSHIPGLKVVVPSTPYDAKGLLKSAIRDENPVVFMEGEMLYNTKGEVPEGEYTIPIGKADVKREGSDVTLVCHSKTVAVALKAADQLAGDRINAEVLDLRTIRPLDTDALLASVAKTHRCVVVEEGWPYAGVGAQVAYEIQERIFDELDAPVLRVTQADVPMPYNRALEKAAKPDPARVAAAVRRVLYVEA